MFKILILAYLIGQDPVDTQKTFILGNNFKTMEECKQELLLNTRFNNTYDVLYNFVVSNATCAKCNAHLVNDTLKLDDGSKVQISKCPNNHGKIKSPLCCGQDMTCSVN